MPIASAERRPGDSDVCKSQSRPAPAAPVGLDLALGRGIPDARRDGEKWRYAANAVLPVDEVSFVEIGNEDWFSSTYPSRYPLFYNAIHASFPSLKIIATSSATGGTPFDVLDEHFYNSPSWFMANSNHYDGVPRGSNKIFVGEWAANEGSPTNDMNSALGDAAWLLGLERNSDLVTMESYAPLWSNVNGSQWAPDLIGFNNTTSYGSPSYYAQEMLANNHGQVVVSSSVGGAGGLQVLVTRTGTTYYLTAVNTLGSANTTTLNLAGIGAVGAIGSAITLSASSTTATNSINNPTNIVPVTSALSGLDATFTHTFPGYSITVLKFTASAQPVTATASFDYQNQQRLTINFSRDVGGTFDASDLQVINQASGQPVSTTGFSYDPVAHRATVSFASPILPDGNYQLNIAPGPTSGLTSPCTLNFFALGGDANRDRRVDLTDFAVLAANFNQIGRDFSQGDFNYDDDVDLTDFTILASNFNRSLPGEDQLRTTIARLTPLPATSATSWLPFAKDHHESAAQSTLEQSVTP